MIEDFIGKYNLSKTLRFSLIPQGDTEKHIMENILENDKTLSLSYVEMKKIIDRYHIDFIEKSLSTYCLDTKMLCEYMELYFTKIKSDKEKGEMKALEEKLRKSIISCFDEKKRKNLFEKDLIKKDLIDFVNQDELKYVEQFAEFTTYFTGFHENRKNMYSSDEKTTAISYRVINENLPKFLDNIKSFQKIICNLPEETFTKLHNDLNILDVKSLFLIDNFAVSQSQIDIYNQILSGYTTENGFKIQGLNEYVNLFNQKNNEIKLPKLKMLYKQILSDRDTISFIPEKFENDNEVINSICSFYNQEIDEVSYKKCFETTKELLLNVENFDLNGIFVKNNLSLTKLSKILYGDWAEISRCINKKYDDENMKKAPKNIEKYEEKRSANLKKIESYSLKQLLNLVDTDVNISKCIADEINRINDRIIENYNELEPILRKEYNKKLISDEETIEKIKNLLDSIKEFQAFALLFVGSGKEAEKDNNFYGEFNVQKINTINTLYDKVRNYVTQKPYSKDKVKLNFSNSTLLAGWDKNKEENNLSIMFRKNDKYYLGIMDKKHNKIFRDVEQTTSDNFYEKMVYKLLPGPNKMLPKVFLSKKGIADFKPSDEILQNYANETHKKGETFNLQHCHKLIDFFKESINKHEDWSQFGFEFSETRTYNDLSNFYNEVSSQGYKIKFDKIDAKYVDKLVREGKLYLFQIYNKDFSENSKGTPNLHTMYFKELFSEENLKDVVYKLNGEAEMFYRKPSIDVKDTVVHTKNNAIKNKNNLNPKRESTFDYDVIKDKRYTKPQFSLHIPITLNFKAKEVKTLNDEVRRSIKQKNSQYVIGIDRGERHLLYVSVINEKNEIVEQYSLNEIINNFNGVEYRTNYHKLLDYKEKERQDARVNWKNIDNIKELKEGYISQVVHKICLLVEKYDAIIAMEDLNSGFKNSRVKVEKQVYQKFEKMLIDKLNYYVNKSTPRTECGGILRAYQLTNKFESFAKMGKQNGIIFYIPAWLTSKIDPTTGFVDLLKPKYTSVNATIEFVSKFDDISYNGNYFEFSFNYKNFPRANADFKNNWTVCTYGTRIKTFRNKDKNSQWDNEEVVLTDEFVKLFNEYNINYNSNLKEQILKQTEVKFFKTLIYLLNLTLQMRNSETGTEIDYLISPVKNADGGFYDSRDVKNTTLPDNADANGAYNIAKKAKWTVEQIRQADDVKKAKFAISNKEWLEYTQK